MYCRAIERGDKRSRMLQMVKTLWTSASLRSSLMTTTTFTKEWQEITVDEVKWIPQPSMVRVKQVSSSNTRFPRRHMAVAGRLCNEWAHLALGMEVSTCAAMIQWASILLNSPLRWERLAWMDSKLKCRTKMSIIAWNNRALKKIHPYVSLVSPISC